MATVIYIAAWAFGCVGFFAVLEMAVECWHRGRRNLPFFEEDDDEDA